MAKWLLLSLLVFATVLPAGAQGSDPAWPALSEQLRVDAVAPRSALEALIASHQDFSLLHPAEARDKIRIPLWLRVMWRRAHPEMVYSPDDPTGGYPFVLKEAHEWMLAHQDLVPGVPEKDLAPGMLQKLSVNFEQRISGSQTAPRSESDIRVNYWDPTKIISASNNISGSGSQAQFYSTDGGVTWGQTTLPRITGDAFHSDPTVDWTSDGTAWATTMGINSGATVLQLRAYRSADNGATWIYDGTISGGQTTTDKQIMWVDHSASSPYKDNIYVIWHNGAPAYINRRTGPNGSWQTPVKVSGAESTGTAIGSDVKTNAFGDVFGFWPTTGNRKIFVVKSTNGGVSYGTPIQVATTFEDFDIGVPAFNNRRILIYVSGGAYRTLSKNLVYASWVDLTGATGCASPANEPGSNTASPCKTRVWFSRSIDGGATWGAPVMINNQASLNDQFNQWMVVDEATGALAIIYYDTVGDPGRKKVDLWYQSSFDDGVTWQPPVKVTSAQTDETGDGADLGNQFGDYNSLSGIAGQFFPSWTDRRDRGYEEIWTAKVSDPACTRPGAPAIGTASAVGPNQLRVTWGNGSPASSLFNVYRAPGTCASPGSFTRIAASAAGSPFTDTAVSGGATYAYRVHGLDATGRCESGPSTCVQATATGTCTLPPAFAGLASAASQETSGCGVTLSWTAASSSCGGLVTYNIYRSTSPGFTPAPGNRLATGVIGTSYTDAAVTNGNLYFYVVRAVETVNGQEDGNSVYRSAVPTGPFNLAETFEGVGGFDTPGWTPVILSGSVSWGLSTERSKSPTHSWHSPGEATTSHRALVSPSFVPRPGLTLSFWHTYSFESGGTCYDGGTLEISTDGGATWSVLPDAAFSAGGFNGIISNSFGNPLGGKRGWCHGTMGEMTQVVADLSSFSGAPSARLRWREGNDPLIRWFGWFIDSVTISDGSVCAANALFSDGFESSTLPGAWSGKVP